MSLRSFGSVCLTLATLGVAGCAGTSSWSPLPAPSFSAKSNSPAEKLAQAAGQPSNSALEAYAQQRKGATATGPYAGNVANAWAGKESTSSPLTRAWTDTRDAVASAFTWEGRVNEAPDPISLSEMPEEVGVEVFLAAGAMQESRQQPQLAAAQYREVLKREPNNLAALISLARLSDRLGDSRMAQDLYRQALAAHPQAALVHNDWGMFQARQGQDGPAAESLAQAVKLAPERQLYRNNFAATLVRQGHYEAALEQLRATALPADAHYNLACLLQRSGRNQLAQQHLAISQDMRKGRSTQPITPTRPASHAGNGVSRIPVPGA